MTGIKVRKHADGQLTINRGRTIVGYWRHSPESTKHRPTIDAVLFPKGPEIVLFEDTLVGGLRIHVAHKIESGAWEFPSDRTVGRPMGFRTIHSRDVPQPERWN